MWVRRLTFALGHALAGFMKSGFSNEQTARICSERHGAGLGGFVVPVLAGGG